MGQLFHGDTMNFERLFILRENHDLYQKDIAYVLGVSQQTYSTWEQCTKIIPLKHLNNLSNYYQINIDYILDLSNTKTNTKIIKELNKKEIGKRIKEVREENNLTLRALAKELNTTSSTISAYETGKTLILTAFAYQIAKKYNISLDWLLGKSNIKNIKKDN